MKIVADTLVSAPHVDCIIAQTMKCIDVKDAMTIYFVIVAQELMQERGNIIVKVVTAINHLRVTLARFVKESGVLQLIKNLLSILNNLNQFVKVVLLKKS